MHPLILEQNLTLRCTTKCGRSEWMNKHFTSAFVISYFIIFFRSVKRPLFQGATKFGGIRKLQPFNDLAPHVFSMAITTSYRLGFTPRLRFSLSVHSLVGTTTTIPSAITNVISITFSVPFAARAGKTPGDHRDCSRGRERGWTEASPLVVKWIRFFARSLGRGTPGSGNTIVSLVL